MSQVISKDGTIIGYDRTGAGPAVILVAGATQFRGIDPGTKRLAELLSANFTVIHYDRRGRGESTDTMPYAVQREVEDIAALVDASGGSAMLYGMSSGAVLATEAAASGLSIEKLALYDPPINPEQPSAVSWDNVHSLEALAARGDRGGMVVNFMTQVGMSPEAIAGFKQSPAWPAFESIGLTIAYDLRSIAEATDGGAITRRWRNATIPALVIDGDASYDFMGPGADAVAASLPNATRMTLKGQSHQVNPAILAPVLTAFFGGT